MLCFTFDLQLLEEIFHSSTTTLYCLLKVLSNNLVLTCLLEGIVWKVRYYRGAVDNLLSLYFVKTNCITIIHSIVDAHCVQLIFNHSLHVNPKDNLDNKSITGPRHVLVKLFVHFHAIFLQWQRTC